MYPTWYLAQPYQKPGMHTYMCVLYQVVTFGQTKIEHQLVERFLTHFEEDQDFLVKGRKLIDQRQYLEASSPW
jgi:hypothetical protein